MSKFSIQFVIFERFLKDHKLSYESLLFLLAEHFDQEVPIDYQDDRLAGEKNAASGMEREEVEPFAYNETSFVELFFLFWLFC